MDKLDQKKNGGGGAVDVVDRVEVGVDKPKGPGRPVNTDGLSRPASRYEPIFRELLATYCEMLPEKRNVRAAYRRVMEVGSFEVKASLDAVELWSTGNRYFDGFPLAVLPWRETAQLVDSGVLTVGSIRATGRLASLAEGIMFQALAQPAFVERLMKSPQMVIAIWDRCMQTDRMPKVIEEMVRQLMADKAEKRRAQLQPADAVIRETLPGAVTEQHVDIDDLSDEELESLATAD